MLVCEVALGSADTRAAFGSVSCIGGRLSCILVSEVDPGVCGYSGW